MKKIGAIFVILGLIITSILFSNLSLAQRVEPTIPGTNLNPSDIPESPEELAKVSIDYLKQEWIKISRNNQFLLQIQQWHIKNADIIDPLFKYTVGLVPSLSFLFILSIVLWLTIVIVIYKISSIFNILPAKPILSKLARFGLTILIAMFISLIRATTIIAQALIEIVKIVNIWWVQLIIAVLIVIALIYIDIISEKISKFFADWKEKKEKKKTQKQAKKALELAEEKAKREKPGAIMRKTLARARAEEEEKTKKLREDIIKEHQEAELGTD